MAGRQPTLRGVPQKSPLGGYLYAIRFSNDVTKVGMSVSPANRVRAHYGYSTGLGIPVTDLWISAPHQRAERNETDLIEFCRANAKQANGREYFVGLDFSDVIGYAETLPYVPAQCSSSAHDIINAARWQLAHNTLRDRILDGTYEPGGRLPSGMDICDEFGISPVTAKRVLKELRASGLAEMQPGIGTFVTELPQPPVEG